MGLSPSQTGKLFLGRSKEGSGDPAVSAILAPAAECGAETSKIYLADAYVEFCTNCRTCTQGPKLPQSAVKKAKALGRKLAS